MDLLTLEMNILLNKISSLKNEIDYKNQKIEVISKGFYEELNKGLVFEEEPEVIEEVKEDEKEEVLNQDIKDGEDKINDVNESIDENETEKAIKNELPTDIKNIFRKIVFLTHPDKIKNDDKDKDIKMKYYLDVQKSAQKNDIANILIIANKLSIEIEVQNDYKEILKQEICNLELQTKNLEYTNVWVWYHTPNDMLKKIMVDRLRETIRKKNKN
jgi:hypothetical protein